MKPEKGPPQNPQILWGAKEQGSAAQSSPQAGTKRSGLCGGAVSSIYAPAWIKRAVEELRPRPRLPASLWAEAYRVLPPGSAIPGPWRNAVTPYLVEIMDRRIFMTSTPTVKTGRIWREKEAADQEKHYFVPCPRCGKYIELVMAQLKWPKKEEDNRSRAARAVYVCQECGGIITDRDKGPMLRAGRWQTVRGMSRGARSAAYWISTLYSPFTRFSEIALEKMLSKGDPERAQNFANSWGAEPWEQAAVKTTADLVLARRTDVPEFVLPEWTRLLTGGVDVQEGSFYWTIRAWGAEMTSQNVAHGQALTFAGVARMMNLPYAKASGERMLVSLALVDSGDQTDMVYELCWQNADWALPCKGVAPMRGNSFQISTINKTGSRAGGMQLVLVDGAKYKDMIAARMRRDNGPGSWMVHKDCDLEYAEQVTAEEKIITLSAGGKPVAKWMPKSSHAANHFLDCETYAACAADIRNVRALDLEAPEENAKPPAAPPEREGPEEAWIRENEDWI